MRPWLLLVVVVVVACTDASPSGPGGTSRTAKMEIPIGGTNLLDVLFVIDDSPAMAAHPGRVAAHIDAFVDVMSALPGGIPDLHVGVTTTDVGSYGGDGGAPGDAIGALGQGGCLGSGVNGNLVTNGAPVTSRFLVDAPFEAGRRTNYTGDLKTVLRQMANVGTGGCAYTRPLEATRRALTPNPGAPGFHRDNAYLAVFHISAGDDCSFADSTFLAGATTADTSRCQSASGLIDVATFAAHLKLVKTDPSKVLVAEVTAGSSPRLHAFAEAFPNRRSETTLDDADPAQAFLLIGQLLKHVLGIPCWSAPLADLDPVAPGLQAECTGQLHTASEEVAMKACAPGLTTPCYRIIEAEQTCVETALSTSLEHVEGYRASNAYATIECLVEATP